WRHLIFPGEPVASCYGGDVTPAQPEPCFPASRDPARSVCTSRKRGIGRNITSGGVIHTEGRHWTRMTRRLTFVRGARLFARTKSRDQWRPFPARYWWERKSARTD